MDTNDQMDALMEYMRDHNNPEALRPHLRAWVHFTPTTGMIFRHPLCYQVWGGLHPHAAHEMIDAKWRLLKEAWRERNWNAVIYLHERPYRLEVLRKLWDTGRLTKKTMRKLLLSWWTDTEIPESNQDDPLHLFREAGFSTTNRASFDALPDEVTLYRGVDGVCELTPHGPSWTTDFKVAKFFGKRYADGSVYKITVAKSEILAWITDRDESEAILDFAQVSDREKIEQVVKGKDA